MDFLDAVRNCDLKWWNWIPEGSRSDILRYKKAAFSCEGTNKDPYWTNNPINDRITKAKINQQLSKYNLLLFGEAVQTRELREWQEKVRKSDQIFLKRPKVLKIENRRLGNAEPTIIVTKDSEKTGIGTRKEEDWIGIERNLTYASSRWCGGWTGILI